MVLGSTDILIDALRETNLLRGDHFDQLVTDIGPRFEDPQELAKHIVRLGWITLYQAKKLLAGHGQDLILGHYVITEKIGEGGMGKVYKAKQLRLSRTVALKVVRPNLLSNEMAMKRFDREAKSAAQLNHPNIVRLFDADQVGDRHYLAMEFIEGSDLAALVKDTGPLPVGMTCSFIRQAATGLHYAHELGLVHRDIKPSNILVMAPNKSGKTDSEGVIKILDMGLARAVGNDEGDAALTALTQDGTVIGTPDFMSPEQAKNSSTVDGRSDLYSLGCTFYYLLTGQSPFPMGTTLEKLLQHQMDQPLHIQLLRRDVPNEVAAIVHKLLAKRSGDRFQTGGALATALEPWSVFDSSGARADHSVKNVPAAIPVADSTTQQARGTTQQQARNTIDADLFDFDDVDVESAPTPTKTEMEPKHNPSETPKKRRTLLWIGTTVAVLALAVGGVFAARHFNKSDPQPTTEPQAAEETKPLPVTKKDLLPPKKGELDSIEIFLPADTDIVAVLNVQQLNKSKFFQKEILPSLDNFVKLFQESVSFDPFRVIDRVVVAVPSNGQDAIIVLSGHDFLNPKFLNWVGKLPGVTKTQETIAGGGLKEIYFLPGKKVEETGKQEDLYGAILSFNNPMMIVLSGSKERVMEAVSRTGGVRSVAFDDASIKPMLARYGQKPPPTLWVCAGAETKIFAGLLGKKIDKAATPKDIGVQSMIASVRLTDGMSLELEIEAKNRQTAANSVIYVSRFFRSIATSNKNDPRFERIAVLIQNATPPPLKNPGKIETPGVFEMSSAISADKISGWFAPFLGKTPR